MHAWLKTAIPKLPSLDIERSVHFFETLGFKRVAVHPTLAMITRDGADIHFWLTDNPAIPLETGCRVNVTGIDALYAEYLILNVVHPKDPLGDKPWGLREFSILDVDGNLLTFSAPIPS
jgi:catechol 2,3-dioxygenase-like lactoylglutathione lyase family enzyme